MRTIWLLPAIAGLLIIGSGTVAASHGWWDDDWFDDDFDAFDDELFDSDDLFDDDDFFDDDLDGLGFGHRFSADFDFESDSDLGSLLLLSALDDGCLDLQTLVLLDALDDSSLSRQELREIALLRHLMDEGIVANAC